MITNFKIFEERVHKLIPIEYDDEGKVKSHKVVYYDDEKEYVDDKGLIHNIDKKLSDEILEFLENFESKDVIEAFEEYKKKNNI